MIGRLLNRILRDRRSVSIIMSLAIAVNLPILAGGDSDFDIEDGASYIPALIKVTDESVDDAISRLQGQGIKILRNREDILLSLIPAGVEPRMRAVKGAGMVEYARPRFNKPTMDVARFFNNGNYIHEGISMPQPFDGKDVVVGICDIGFDTHHPNFMTSDGKESRVKKVVQYRELEGLRKVLETPEEIYAWHTDDDSNWHASHVAGIAAGGYMENGYYGMAPASDIVFTGSQLSDVGLLAGVEDVIEYAKSVGKPAVVNLSMGNNIGPHDGSSLFCQYLDRCAEDAIICISTGNDGSAGSGTGVSLTHRFKSEGDHVGVLVTDWSGMHNYGVAQIWSEDGSPFKLTFYLQGKSENVFFDTIDLTDTEDFYFRLSADPADEYYNEEFASHFYFGMVELYGGLDAENGRRYVEMFLDCMTEDYDPDSEENPGGYWASYWPAVKVEGEEGKRIDIFAGGNCFLRGARGYSAPDNSMCVSDLATGFNTITVGMTNNKSRETKVDGSVLQTGYPEGEVCKYSSYGTLTDGRVMPMTCAPGAIVVSSMSSAYIARNPGSESWQNAKISTDTGDYYWVSNTGTSMSTPYVVGTVATWLQAYPQLKYKEAQDIIKATNKSALKNPEDVRNGQGWFDPYGGMLEILSLKSLIVDKLELHGLAICYKNGSLFVTNYEGSLNYGIYDANGRKIISGKLEEIHSEINLGIYDKGIYMAVFENAAGIRKVNKLFVN